MENNDHKTLEELQERILAARDKHGVDLRLIADVVAYAEARSVEGMALNDVADELGMPRWQLTDWIERAKKQGNRRRKPVGGTLKVVLELPLEVPTGGLFLDGLSIAGLSLRDLLNQVRDWLMAQAPGTGEGS